MQDQLNAEITRLRGLHELQMKEMADNYANLVNSSFVQVKLESGRSVSLLTEHAAELLYCHPPTFEKFKSMAINTLTEAAYKMRAKYDSHINELEDECHQSVEINLSQLSNNRKKRGAMRLADLLFAKAKGAQVVMPEIKRENVPDEEDRLKEEAEKLVGFNAFALKNVQEGGLAIAIPHTEYNIAGASAALAYNGAEPAIKDEFHGSTILSTLSNTANGTTTNGKKRKREEYEMQ